MKTAIKQQGNDISKVIDLYYDRALHDQKLLKQKEQVKQHVHDTSTILQKEKAMTRQMKDIMHALKGSWCMQELRNTLRESSDQQIVSGTHIYLVYIYHHLTCSMKKMTERYKEVNTKPVESANLTVNEPLPQILTIDSLSFEVKDFNSSNFVQQGEIAMLEIITKYSKDS